jgi:hypothetical protein
VSARPLAALLGLALAGACSVVRVDAHELPPRIESRGLIRGHAALGVRAEERLFDLELLRGRSSFALAELVVWRALRVEIGLAGVALGLGPIDLALGTVFYDPVVPRFVAPEPDECEPAALDADG